MIRRGIRACSVLLLPLALVACGEGKGEDRNLDSLDAELADGNSADNLRDPSLMSALHDQIMVDPALAGQANHDAIRPPGQPYSAQVAPDATVSGSGAGAASATSETLKSAPSPAAGKGCPKCGAAREALTLGGLAARQGDGGTKACVGSITYSTRWALRLPAAIPLYPDARVSEAAGTEQGKMCAACREFFERSVTADRARLVLYPRERRRIFRRASGRWGRSCAGGYAR